MVGLPEENLSAPPLVLGRYEILGKLGTGGMATVYLARNVGEAGFQRLCAIKVLHPHLAEQAGFIEMLLDEAKIAARLHHPNVVPIVDLGTHESILYVAMEYVEGCSLSALLRKYAAVRPPRLLVPIMLDVLAGLDAAHSSHDEDGNPLNIVHRDVSPQNVLLGVDGATRLTDFGIARAGSRITSTRPGQLKGKIMYMSPEQIRGEPIDARSDVFSAGVMLWTMLTGVKLFVGDNDAATMNNILGSVEVPRPSTVGFKPPAALDAVCLKALERDVSKRFATAQAMEDALREAATQHDLLGSRREVGEWVVRGFRDELAARRKEIRSAGMARGSGRNPIQAMAEFPSFTPSSISRPSSQIPAVGRSGTIGEPATQPMLHAAPRAGSDDAIISVVTDEPTPVRWRRWAIGGVAAIGAVILAIALRPSGDSVAPAPTPPSTNTAAVPSAPSPATPAPPAAAPPAAPSPAIATPTQPPPSSAAPSLPAVEPPQPRPTIAAQQDATPVSRPTRVGRKQPVRTPPKAPVVPPPVAKPAPDPKPLALPPVEPPPKPTPQQPQPKWDSDSPVPPP